MVGLLFNHTSELVSLHMPETAVDVYYNDVRAGNATVAPNVLVPGWNPWQVSGFVLGDNVTAAGDALNRYLSSETVDVVLRGAEAASDACYMQRILKRVSIPVPIEPEADSEEGSSVALSSLDLHTLTRTDLSFTASVATRTNFTVEGSVPSFTLEIARLDADGNVVGAAFSSISVSPFTFETAQSAPSGGAGMRRRQLPESRATFDAAIAISDDRAAFDTAFGIFDDKFIAVRVSGAGAQGQNVLSQLLQGLKVGIA